jgi:hypothetical protein
LSGRHRVLVVGLVLLALLDVAALVAFAANACPVATSGSPCPGAATNRIIVVALAALGIALFVTPFAFLAEFVVRRRIVYRGAWGRAIRRGVLAGAAVAALAGLRLGGALTVPVGIFVVLLAVLVEWLAVRRFDQP